jgi:A/G-specific adenine glycosylase
MPPQTPSVPDPRIPPLIERVLAEGQRAYRDFPWRHTCDPYEILLSEVMLQQTQATRVIPYYERWLEQFPTLDALAAAPLEAVLRAWQGLGYNRRALALKRLAEQLAEATPAGPAQLPREEAELRALPGIGPATAAGIRAFAFDLPAAYLETNVRTVFLHELFSDDTEVSDRCIAPLVAQAAETAEAAGVSARVWNYALLDYGALMKRTMPNPSRRSAHHTKQSRFEGSRRQVRAQLLRLVIEDPGHTSEHYAAVLGSLPDGGTRAAYARELLEELAGEGFLTCDQGRYFVA